MSNQVEFLYPKTKKESKFIGLKLDKKGGLFSFPCSYFSDVNDISEKEIRTEAKKILTLIKRVQQDYQYGGIENELSQFYSMVWLIQDYIDNGYYVETEVVSKIDYNGKINWKKTIKNNSIYFDGKNVVYKDIVHGKNITNDAKILSSIYKACLEYSINVIGFVFYIFSVEKSIFSVEKDKQFMLSFLKKELNNTFKDYKKVLIKQLLSIINGANETNNDYGFSIYDVEFEYCFERMVNQVFGTEDVKKFYNEYFYMLDEKYYQASKLRPDTIMKIDNTYYIVDSKYYNYGYTNDQNDLPQSSSIAKQIGYNHYLRQQLIDKNEKAMVKSIFILPFAAKENEEKIVCVGYAEAKNNPDENDRITVFLVDLKELINNYLGIKKTLSSKMKLLLEEKNNLMIKKRNF